MVRKRDGPRIAANDQGPEQGDVGPASLPPRNPRNTQGHTSPSSHRRSRQRQPQGWRQFNVRVVTGPDSAAVHALHTFLRAAARRYGLTIVRIDKIGDDDKSE
jgi:hypothetical protein